MPATYRCDACNATWTDDRQPDGCPKCGSRFVERKSSSNPFDDAFLPPGSSIAVEPKANSTSFSILYWLSWVGMILGFVLVGLSGALDTGPPPKDEPNPVLAGAGGLVIVAGAFAMTAATIISFVKLYRGWKAIQPLRRLDRAEAEMTTPGMAVGLLFVPFWNLYWMFVAMHGLTVKANKYMRRVGIEGRPMNEGMALTYCILTLCAIIPCLGVVLALANVVVYYLFILDVDRMRGLVAASTGGDSKLMLGVDFEPL